MKQSTGGKTHNLANSKQTGTGTGYKLTAYGWQSPDADAVARREDWGVLPDGLADIVQRDGGDITGRAGTGATVQVSASDAPCTSGELSGSEGRAVRAVKVKPARAVGNGRDADTVRRDELDAWRNADAERETMTADAAREIAEARAAILADLATEQGHGLRVLTLAGGKGYGQGRHVHLQSGGMAARAARFIWRRHLAKGNDTRPSDTSLNEAAAAAACALAVHLGKVAQRCKLPGLVALPLDAWQRPRFIMRASARAWRAARHSLTHDASEGRTGRRGTGTDNPETVTATLDAATLERERASLEAWAASASFGAVTRDTQADQLQSEQRAQRRRVLTWFASVLQVRAPGRTGQAERARFSVLVRMVHGADIATASRLAGFANGKQALESFRTGNVWARLRDASSGHGREIERLREQRRTAASQAVHAIRAQRAARSGASSYADQAPAVARVVTVPSGACAVVRERGNVATARFVGGYRVKLVRPSYSRAIVTRGQRGTGKVNRQARVWLDATEQRADAVTRTHESRRKLRNAIAERASQVDKATRGLRSGWLRT